MKPMFSAFFAVVFALSVGGCTSTEPIQSVAFTAGGDGFTRDIGDGFAPFFPRGVTLGSAKPGFFVGEQANTAADFRRWIGQIAAMNANVIRVPALQKPAFYEEFAAYNLANPDAPLYLLQGIWLPEPTAGWTADNYFDQATTALDQRTRQTVDAVFGNATIAPTAGEASGTYTTDVSPWLMGWLVGRPLDGFEAQKAQKSAPNYVEYAGRYITVKSTQEAAHPLRAWVARALDHVVTAELDGYGTQHPVAWNNSPALDPMKHPTETKHFGEDLVDVDLAGMTASNGFSAGVFASYEVYPWTPEFLLYDPQYGQAIDRGGRHNSYQGYVQALVAAHAGVPVLVSGFGVASSMGVGRYNEKAENQGGHTEAQQAQAGLRLYHALVDAGVAGALLGSWLDDWSRTTWMTRATTLPLERRSRWQDALDPRQHMGVVAFDPKNGAIRTDGSVKDWPSDASEAARENAGILRKIALFAGPRFLHIHLETDPDKDLLSPTDAAGGALAIGLDTVDGDAGQLRWPAGMQTADGAPMAIGPGNGLESVVWLQPDAPTWQCLTAEKYDPTARINGLADSGGEAVSDQSGVFVSPSWIVNGAQHYVAAGANFTPLVRRYFPGNLQEGDSKTLTTAHFLSGKGHIELRLPWTLLWVTDPSSRHVLADDPATPTLDSRQTKGVSVAVAWMKRAGDKLELVEGLPRASAGSGQWAGTKRYAWPTWDKPAVTERRKSQYWSWQQLWAADPERKL